MRVIWVGMLVAHVVLAGCASTDETEGRTPAPVIQVSSEQDAVIQLSAAPDRAWSLADGAELAQLFVALCLDSSAVQQSHQSADTAVRVGVWADTDLETEALDIRVLRKQISSTLESRELSTFTREFPVALDEPNESSSRADLAPPGTHFMRLNVLTDVTKTRHTYTFSMSYVDLETRQELCNATCNAKRAASLGVLERELSLPSCDNSPSWAKHPPCLQGNHVYAAGEAPLRSLSRERSGVLSEVDTLIGLMPILKTAAHKRGGSLDHELRDSEGIRLWICQGGSQNAGAAYGQWPKAHVLARTADETLTGLDWPTCETELPIVPKAWLDGCPDWTGSIAWKDSDGRMNGVSTILRLNSRFGPTTLHGARTAVQIANARYVRLEVSPGGHSYGGGTSRTTVAAISNEETKAVKCGAFTFVHFSADVEGKPMPQAIQDALRPPASMRSKERRKAKKRRKRRGGR